MASETRPIRKTTLALLEAASREWQANIQRIADLAVEDGEAPPGAKLTLAEQGAHWLIETPDIAPAASTEPVADEPPTFGVVNG